METLVIVAHHRNQYYSGSRKGNSSIRFDSSPSRGFRDMNCRAFEAGIGLLPNPVQGYGSPVLNRGVLSPKPQFSCSGVGGTFPFGGGGGGGAGRESKSEDVKKSKKFVKSSPIAIKCKNSRQLRENMSLSELWAGPAYSNSPPPSSLPIPKFGMKPKRTVSLELPAFESDLILPQMAKSVPTSPTSSCSCSSSDFFSDDDCATKTLRRILNLDIADD